MRTAGRMAWAAVLGGAVFSSVPAVAAPPRAVCRLVIDPAGDMTDLLNPNSVPELEDPAADIVSADIASNRHDLTAVIRVHELKVGPASELWHQFYFWIGDVPFRFHYSRKATGVTYEALRVLTQDVYSGPAVSIAGATGVEDPAAGEIRITLPLDALAEHAPVRSGTVVRRLAVWTNRGVGQGVFARVVDEAYSNRTYRLGTRSCVPVGR